MASRFEIVSVEYIEEFKDKSENEEIKICVYYRLRLQSSSCGRSLKCECHTLMQMQHTKNLNPGRFELGTTLS